MTITCQACGSTWPAGELFDNMGELNIARFYFRSDPPLDRPKSLQAILDAGALLVGCPKDQLDLDLSMGGLDEHGLQPDRSPDSGERSPGREDADALHDGS